MLAWTYRALNVLHVRTAAAFIRGELLFEEGDCLDSFLLEESARLLDEYDFLRQATVEAEDDGAGGHRVRVVTRDEWSTQVDVGLTYDEGLNLERLQVTEINFLGQGIFGEFTHRERREERVQSFGVATPRLFGRTDASVAFGRARPGRFMEQSVRYPFVGETGRFAVRQGYLRGTDFFSYSTDDAEAFTQVLVPAYRELLELSAAHRMGDPGASVVVGASLTRDVRDFRGVTQVAFDSNFDEPLPFEGPLPARLDRQMVPTSSTALSLHVGTRRYRFEEYVGLDGVRDRQFVAIGSFAGLSVGRSFDALAPSGVTGLSDTFGRFHASFGAPVGSSLLHGVVTAEGRRDGGQWGDVVVDADLVSYLRNDALPGQTFFLRASAAGGWSTTRPFQLGLGGRYAVRSLSEDDHLGGRVVRFVAEDRIAFPWPSGAMDLGLTLFTDVGRMWAGDVPYGRESGWEAGVGFGLRLGLPSGTRNIFRTDFAFPVGGGDPVFRVTLEVNRLRGGFFTEDALRSRRLELGVDQFYSDAREQR